MKLASLRPHVAIWGLRGAWVLAVTLWALALVPWFRTPPPAPLAQGATPAAVPRSLTAASQPSARGADEEIAEATMPVPVARARAASAPDAVASASERGARDGTVCGLADGAGNAIDTPSASLRSNHVARQASLGMQQVFDALRARPDMSAQAAGWWLRVLVAREGTEPSLPACPPGVDCAAVPAGQWPAPAAAVDALAQLAQATNDAWVQQIALRACDGSASALCASLGTRRWSTLEPDNAAAWIELAARDPQAIDEALFGVRRASRIDAHRGRLAAWVLQASPESLPAMQRYAAWQRSDELERAADARVAAAAARACTEGARRDANRDQLCDGAARWLAQNPRPATGGEPTPGVASRALDCATVERLWREARDGALHGTRVASGTPLRP
ncbi:MAG TPA: hypothetical protein VFU71_20205 [Burkholderiaceae bacterium]|nr:hypothetical protein [Burkholderiaceae bacterium]